VRKILFIILLFLNVNFVYAEGTTEIKPVPSEQTIPLIEPHSVPVEPAEIKPALESPSAVESDEPEIPIIEPQESTSEKKSLILVPAVSFFLPGFGTALDQNYQKASLLLGYAISGYFIQREGQRRMDEFIHNDSGAFHSYRDSVAVRNFGQEMWGHAGMLSTFDTFTSRLAEHQKEGKYLFLPKEQNLESVLKAPFQFTYMSRMTTLIPFAMAMAGAVGNFKKEPAPKGFHVRTVDLIGSTYSSYGAGTGEEAFFRGWMFPVLYENSDNLVASNIAQALAFGLAHGGRPYFQTAAGYYFGWLTARNNFDIGESIFVHAWWDFWVIGAIYARNRSLVKDYDFKFPLVNTSF
jgi:membrane protease YdiL (CAAX protease family)